MTENDARDDELADVVAAEEKQLPDAASLREDIQRVHRESDVGPTADTMLTAWGVQEDVALAPRLRSLHMDTAPSEE